ncbi:MAG: binding-protein-dependent transport system inner rane component, partial [Verrucomicrobiales bacterium]|nr:binding-protein-dependent transport system inner rane component [Verrucomicrobiales bacterium]
MYYLKRILSLVPVLLIISFVCFFIMRISPGGPFDRERKLPEEVKRNIEKKYHLDQPVLKQYLLYLGGLMKGDFGPSLKYRNHSVTEIIAAGLPVSVALGLSSFLFAMGLGIPLGVYSAPCRQARPGCVPVRRSAGRLRLQVRAVRTAG